jgi:four helix bundle protein
MPTAPVDFQSRSFRFACDVVRLFRLLDGRIPREIGRQVLRSGTSVGASLTEGKAAQSRRDLRSKFSIALKEARETQFWLRLIAATFPHLEATVADALDESSQLVAILTVSVMKLREEREGKEARVDIFPRSPDAG